jgi:hypothetical protein
MDGDPRHGINMLNGDIGHADTECVHCDSPLKPDRLEVVDYGALWLHP